MKFAIPVKKINTLIEFDDETLPQASKTFSQFYGLKQWLADAHAGIIRKDYAEGDEGNVLYLADVQKAVADRVTKLRTGVGLPGTSSDISPELVAALEHVRKMASDPEYAARVTAAMSGTTEPEKKKKAA